jgi:hypothetical protein
MQDAITSVINSSDVQGKYLDTAALEKLKGYFATGELRVRAATTISANAAAIVKEAVKVSGSEEIEAIIALGFAGKGASPKKQKADLENIVFFEKYGAKKKEPPIIVRREWA